jgi:HK97 family phage portal protein
MLCFLGNCGVFETLKSWWQTKAVPLSSPAALEIFGAPVASGPPIDALSAMRVPAVAQGVRLVSESVATLDWALYRETPRGREMVPPGDHAAARLLTRPNPWFGESELKRQIIQDMILHGNGLLLVSRVRNEPRELHRIDPRSCSIIVDQISGEPKYSITLLGGGTAEFTHGDVVHLRGPTLDGARGLGIVALGAETIGLALTLEKYAAGLFARSARPGGVLETPKPLSVEAMQRLRASFSSIYQGGDNSGKTAILESGVKFTPLQLTSTDAQFLELRKFSVLEIARLLNIPPVLIGDMEHSTLSNAETLAQIFLDRTLVPLLEMAEDQLERVLLTDEERDGGYAIEFCTEGFVRADVEKRFGAYKSAIESGAMLLNEVRSREGLPPVAGGDEPMRSVQTIPLAPNAAPPATQPKEPTS